MAYQQLGGQGLWLGVNPDLVSMIVTGSFSSSVIDATGEKFAWVGRVWFPGRTGTKSIRRVGFRFGAVTKAGGSALTVSLQDVNASAGPPGQPDETQDQTVAIANADASFASNTWYRTGTFSADRTVTYGDHVAVVIEYDGGGRLGADAVNLTNMGGGIALSLATPVLKTGGSWATAITGMPNILLEMSDGTFGCLEGSIPIKAFNSHVFGSGSAADEHALAFSLPFPCKVDGLRFIMSSDDPAADFDVVLYEGTTARRTVSVDANRPSGTSARVLEVPIEEYTLAAGTTYYAALKPTTANVIIGYSLDVDDANHLSVYPGGTGWAYSSRVDAGSWAAVTTTRQFMAGIRVSAVDDAAPSGGGLKIAGRGGLAG